MFHYAGNLRLQLWFSSPNICGAFLCLAFFTVLGLHLFFAGEKRVSIREYFRDFLLIFRFGGGLSFFSRFRRISGAIFFLLALFVEYLLARTYSRGGYVAFFAGLGLMLMTCRRKRLLFLGLAFFLIIASVSSWMKRFASVCEVSEGSIYNRLVLWRGMAAIMADNPMRGAGSEPYGHIGELYYAWHQPFEMEERYTTAVCDVLTIGAERGIFAIFAYLTLALSLIWASICLHKAAGNGIALGLSSASFSYLVASLFSAFCKDAEIYRVFWEINILLAIFAIYGFLRGQLKFSYRLFLFPFGMALTLSFIVFAVGYCCAVLSDIKYSYHEFPSGDARFRWVSAIPKMRNGNEPVHVLYFFDSDRSCIEEEARKVIRPLASAGVAIDAIGVDSGFSGLRLAEEFIRSRLNDCGDRIFLAGRGSGGRIALLAGIKIAEKRIASLVAIDSEMDWPFPDLSPMANVEKINFSVLLLYSSGNDNSRYTGIMLQEKLRNSQQKKQVRVELVKNVNDCLKKARDFILTGYRSAAVRFIRYEFATIDEMKNATAWLFGTESLQEVHQNEE